MNITGVADIAKALCLSSRRVQQLVKEGVLPSLGRGVYDLSACIEAYNRYKGELELKDPVNNALEAERLRLLKAQARKAELESGILEGKYIEVSEVEFEWSDLIVKFRTRMLAMPGKLVRQLATAGGDFAAIEKLLEDEIYDALLELSRHDDEEHQNN